MSLTILHKHMSSKLVFKKDILYKKKNAKMQKENARKKKFANRIPKYIGLWPKLYPFFIFEATLTQTNAETKQIAASFSHATVVVHQWLHSTSLRCKLSPSIVYPLLFPKVPLPFPSISNQNPSLTRAQFL